MSWHDGGSGMASERAREAREPPGGSGATDGGKEADAEPAGQDTDAGPRGQESRRGEEAGDPLAAAKTSDEAFEERAEEERAEEEGREEEERRAEEEETERARPRPGGGPSLPAVSPRAAIARPLLPQSEQSVPSSLLGLGLGLGSGLLSS